METQMPIHHDTGRLHATGMEGEEEDHHEKKSVIKKVKAKAKKIKDKLTPDKLTPHGHGSHHDQHAGHDQEDDDDQHGGHDEEDDDDDDKMVQDPKIHGAPIYESAAIRSGVAGPGANTGQSAGVNYLERPSVKEEKHHDDSPIYDPPVRPSRQWEEESSGQGRPTETQTPVDKDVSFKPNVAAPASDLIGHGRDKIGELPAIEEDPHAPKHQHGATAPSNYESKVTNPTAGGGQEAGVTSILPLLDKMKIDDEKSKSSEETKTYTGSHDQFAPETVPKSFNPDKPEELPRDTLTGHQSQSNQSSYREQISSATSAIASKAVAAKDAIATKLGYSGGESNTGTGESTKSVSTAEYANKISATMTEKLAPVYEKVAVAGSTLMSKVQGTGTGTGTQMEKGPDKGVSVTTYLTERFKPGDEDKALSEVITHAFKRGNEEKGKERETESGQEKPILEMVSGDVHKRGVEEEGAGEGKKLGKVTEEKGKERETESGQEKPISEMVSGDVHKQGVEEEGAGEGKKLGKVTESEEVKKRLGTGEEREEGYSGGGQSNVGAQKGMADRLKGAVSSWWGKGGEPQSTGTTYVTDQGLTSSTGGQDEGGGGHNAGERKLQESTY